MSGVSIFLWQAKGVVCCLQDNTRLWRPLLRRQLQRHGSKPLWVSEFGTGRGPLALAKQIVKDLATLRPTAWVYWWVAVRRM